MILLRIRKGKTCGSFTAAGRSSWGSRCWEPRGLRKIVGIEGWGWVGVVRSWWRRFGWFRRLGGLGIGWLGICGIGVRRFGLRWGAGVGMWGCIDGWSRGGWFEDGSFGVDCFGSFGWPWWPLGSRLLVLLRSVRSWFELERDWQHW